MIEDVPPVLPPGVADRFIELYLLVPLLSIGILWLLYSLARKLNFYLRNGFRSPEKPRSSWINEDTGKPVGPVANVLLDIVMIVFLGIAILSLLGVLGKGDIPPLKQQPGTSTSKTASYPPLPDAGR